MSEEKNRKMQVLTKTDEAVIDELKGLIDATRTPRERAARQYIIDAFRGKMSSLISFAFENESILKLAAYLLRHTTGSKATLFQYTFGVYRFSRWINKNPDEIIRESLLDHKVLDQYVTSMDDFIGDLQAEKLAPGTIANHVKGVKALFRTNGVEIVLPYKLPRRTIYHDRSPTPEELTRLIDIADIRDKVIISLLALGGFRVGTLVKLQYRHVRRDLEASVVPIHVHVEAEITKGKYHEYDTFLGAEATEYLKAYFEMRRKGTEYIPPEKIEDSSPIIRNERTDLVQPVSSAAIHRLIGRLYTRTDMRKTIAGKSVRYDLRVHSIRKFFRTQLGSLGTIPTDYIEYMMGHTISTYNDVRMKGIDFLRNLYSQSGLSIRSRTKLSKIDQLKTIIEAWGLNPYEILSREAMTRPNRTIIDTQQSQVEALNQALKETILKELQVNAKAVY